MSDTVVLVAIVVPAMAMVTLGTVAIVFGRRFNLSAHATPQGAEFKAEGGPEPAIPSRPGGRKPARRQAPLGDSTEG